MTDSKASVGPASENAQGSGAPEKRLLRVGYVPLTDCAPLVVAVELGLDRRHGIQIELRRQPSWAAIRDKLLSGELDAAHSLSGLALGVELGIGGPRRPMAVLMTLNQNGQAITLSRELAARIDDPREPSAVAAAIRGVGPERPVLAHTFPTGTHAMWLHYWLAAQGLDPLHDVQSVVIPPPQMAQNLLAGELDGCCVGEPWSAQAEASGAGVTIATSDAVWPDHPEKVLSATRAFVESCPNAARALVMALLEACRRLDQPSERRAAAELLARPGWIDAPYALIAARLTGDYGGNQGGSHGDNSSGNAGDQRGASAPGRPAGWPALEVARPLRFFGDGEVTFPYVSDAIWFMTQYRRWGMLPEAPDYRGIAARVCQTGLYREAAARLGIASPASDSRASVLMGGRCWDGSDPAAWSGDDAR